jgi:hypothetical protein
MLLLESLKIIGFTICISDVKKLGVFVKIDE